MKSSLIAGIGTMILAGGIAFAKPPITKAPDTKVQMANIPDCPEGFVKTNAAGDPKSSHHFTCTTQLLHCPPGPPGLSGPAGMAQPVAKTTGTGNQLAVTFSYECLYQQIN